ncbi:MAG: hypothetical protein ABUL67_00605 [Haliangium ochraceum]
MNLDARLEQEALRLADRYVREIVLGFGLCPWAEPALREGRVGRAVCLAAAPAPAACLPFIDGFADPPVDIGLLLFPRHRASWGAFDAFAERVRRADRERRGPRAGAPAAGGVAGPEFLIAAFHPDGPDGATAFDRPHQLVSFLRRTPDPMLQFVRAEIIDEMKKARPGGSDDVGRRNHASLSDSSGVDGGGGRRRQALDEVVRAIRADREASYARLGDGAAP